MRTLTRRRAKSAEDAQVVGSAMEECGVSVVSVAASGGVWDVFGRHDGDLDPVALDDAIKRARGRKVEPDDMWGDVPGHPLCDWVAEVASDETRLGYHEWVRKMSEDDDPLRAVADEGDVCNEVCLRLLDGDAMVDLAKCDGLVDAFLWRYGHLAEESMETILWNFVRYLRRVDLSERSSS